MKRHTIYMMYRKSLTILILTGLMSFLFSCTIVSTTKVKHAPPGQVKKATGSQSAKPYAPGQQKKKSKN